MSSTTRKNPTRAQCNNVSQYDAQAFGNSDVIYAGPAALQSILVTNKSSSALFLQLFDLTAVPANTAVPAMCPIEVPANTTLRIPLNDIGGQGYDGVQFNNGICWAASTSGGTLTVDSTNSIWVTARYMN